MMRSSLTSIRSNQALDVVHRFRASHAKGSLWLLAIPMAGSTLLAKFSIPPFGARGIAIGMLLTLLVAVLGVFFRRFVLNPGLLIGFTSFFAFASLIPMLRGEAYSLPSLVLMVFLHVPYAAQAAKEGGPDTSAMLKLFSRLTLFIALCGIGQFVLQFVIGPVLSFPIENFVPDLLQVQAFNKQGPLAYGSNVFRSNGVFLLEPSFFSQLMAIGIICELALTRIWWRAAVMALALLLSYSGTGMLILLICLPIVALAYRRWQLLPMAALALAAVLIAADYLNLDLLVSRAGEFNSSGSSAFARFVGGFYLFDEFLWGEGWRTWFGYGAGSFSDYAYKVSVPVVEMAVPKMVFEFGLLGAAAYFGLIAWAISRSGAPFVLKLAVYISYFLNGNYTYFSHGFALSLFIWPVSKPAHDRMDIPLPFLRRGFECK